MVWQPCSERESNAGGVSEPPQRRLRILTWHVHGDYLYALTQLPHDFVIPVLPGTTAGYTRPGPAIPWADNLQPVPAQSIHEEMFDCVIYQSRKAYEMDRFRLLTAAQLELPAIYIEHNPPESHPTDTVHWFRHDAGVLVHVTHYNALMWHSPDVETCVIEHGMVAPPAALYTGERNRGIVVINHLRQRQRRVGADLFEWAARQVPLDLIGMGSEDMHGLGEVPNMDVPSFIAQYRFFFSPIRYASLGLSLIEAMMAGLPVVGIAATELPNVIRNGVNGWVDSRPDRLVECMHELMRQPEMARQWGAEARQLALSRFSITRFTDDWNRLLAACTEHIQTGATS